MAEHDDTIPDVGNDPAFQERVRLATEVLEELAERRGLLAWVPDELEARLHEAAGEVYAPDAASRRQLVKARVRRRKAETAARDEARLDATGIRRLRQQDVFTTPNVYPPEDFQQVDVTHAPAPTGIDAGPATGGDAGSGTGDVAFPLRLEEARHCYTCKADYREVHHFYDQLCPACAALNWRKRGELADLSGRVALLTGGRVKIGYQAGIKLLRSGARLIVTTRFPRDAAARYAAEEDFHDWGERLEIYGLDLRHTPSVEAFCHHLLETRERLDYIVNNACQTVRRPPAFYRHMMEGEARALEELTPAARGLLTAYEALRGEERLPTPGTLGHGQGLAIAPPSAAEAPGLARAAELSQAPLLPDDHLVEHELFPAGRLDQDLQQVDLRGRNSWRLLLDEVSSVELLEVQLVNAVAPFVLNGRLKPLMLRTPERDKHIVNVSAVEGQFYRNFKTTRHPHTNMAKAALNMMTRTSATDYHGDGIHMNAVDTGWVTDEDPAVLAERKRTEQRFHPPLDIVDGAARIVDPIIDGMNTGVHVWGKFLKDYRETDW